MPNYKKALFLDRDGTLIHDKHYLSDPDQIELLPNAESFLKAAQAAGYLLFILSNQSGIGRGYFKEEDIIACNKRMLDLLNLGNNLFTKIKLCPETPEEEPNYRKPSPKFILEMIKEHTLNPELCWMIGDKLCDIQTGINAAIQAAWVSTGKAPTEELNAFMDEHKVPGVNNLDELLPLILESSSAPSSP